MMKAAAPITGGGMIWPPIDAVASTRGSEAAIAEADHQRNGELSDGDDIGNARARDRSMRPDETHRDFGRPPRAPPNSPSEMSLNRWIIPARSRNEPNRMKRKM